MSAREQLEALLRVQDLALGIREAESIIESKPARLEQIEAHFRERNAEYVAVQTQHDELEADRKSRAAQLQVLEQSRDKYQAGLMEVKNQREYSAVLKEIDTVKAEIAAHEEAVLKAMETLELLRVELANHEAHIVKERADVAEQTAKVLAETQAAAERLEGLRADRAAIESKLPLSVRGAVGRLEVGRQGVFLARAENGTCLACFVRVRPQVFQEIRQALKVHTCDSCRRFLYHEPSMKAAETRDVPADGQTV